MKVLARAASSTGRYGSADHTERNCHHVRPPRRTLAAQLAPLSQDGTYVNFLTDTAGDSNTRVQAACGDALYDRLARLKRESDPSNLFRADHNIRPAR